LTERAVTGSKANIDREGMGKELAVT